ncbi:hypothetical protein E5288_WYG022880 [Bos mutus]|uniref:Uncharacterized protein n=1 Tax=Bos mutus TaxID=72004 RepID=A0A6B0SBJ5_9CETA|nr:hypothetical protein [Bos mutus]
MTLGSTKGSAQGKPHSLSDKTPAITRGRGTETRQLIRQDPGNHTRTPNRNPTAYQTETPANHTRTPNRNPTAYQTRPQQITRGPGTETRRLIRQDPGSHTRTRNRNPTAYQTRPRQSHADAEPKPNSLSDRDPSKSHADPEPKLECPDFFLHDLYLHLPFSHSCPHMPILFLKKSYV